MQQHIQTIQESFKKLKKMSKNLIKTGFFCLFILTGAAAVLAVLDMLNPGIYSEMPMLIKSLFTYGFYLWAELTVGALILDYIFK
ncbi:MAG: hypothetical protein GX045_04710 [Clostridiaceae bacterium]|nr:hypothetical protein [Clostridiaceae bacterium]